MPHKAEKAVVWLAEESLVLEVPGAEQEKSKRS